MTQALSLLSEAMIENDSLACCGLDPDITKLPYAITKQRRSKEAMILRFLREIIDITGPHVCSYKVQKAFFDVFPAGHELLRETISYAHERYPGIPLFIDAKVGDIDNTMLAYLQNIFGEICADGLVVNPYMGDDVLKPFESIGDKAAVVLVKTSNLGGSIVQDIVLPDGRLLWQYVLDLVVNRWNAASNLIPVLSSTSDTDMMDVRRMIPDTMPILFAGFGAQGGSLQNFRQLLDSSGRGVFVNSSRGLLYPYQTDERNWQRKVLAATIALKEELNRARS